MEGLSQEQLEFLKWHDIPLEKIFDAKGYSKSDYHFLMKQQGKIVAFNVTPCKLNGHTLRTRNGHCIQCDPARIEFQKRYDYSGIIYIAGSKNGSVLKVGYSKGIDIRSESINRTKYAGYEDWEIVFGIFSPNAGEIETQIKPQLVQYNISLRYEHDNSMQIASEIYTCSYTKIKSTIIMTCDQYSHKYEIVKDYDGTEYNFRNLTKL